MDLESLVRQHGPLPAARVVHHPSSGLRVAGRGARARSRPSRHQAGQHSPRSARAAARLRQGARLRARQVASFGRPRSRWRPIAGVDRGHARLHGAGDGAGRARRRPRRSVRARLRRLLPAHRGSRCSTATGAQGDHPAPAGGAGAAVRGAPSCRSRRRSNTWCWPAWPRNQKSDRRTRDNWRSHSTRLRG